MSNLSVDTSYTYPWYRVINDHSVQQGDIFFKCPVLSHMPPDLKPDEQKDYELEFTTWDLIVVTQACDLDQGKIDHVLTCRILPVYNGEDFAHGITKNFLDNVVKRANHRYALLNKYDDGSISLRYGIVDFNSVYSIPIDWLHNFATSLSQDGLSRLRLLPPYREHLNQAFAMYFMRIGLPVDIDRDDLNMKN